MRAVISAGEPVDTILLLIPVIFHAYHTPFFVKQHIKEWLDTREP